MPSGAALDEIKVVAQRSAPDAEARIAAIENELAEFSTIVSHDLSATFRQVSGFMGLLMRDLDGKLEPSQRSYADRIQTSAARCQAMLEQLLAYSRVQQAALDIAACDATLLADEARLNLAHETRSCGAQISVEALGWVRADRRLMAQAFKRLLDNAIKFRRPDTAPRIAIRLASGAEGWAVHIVDNGVGVAIEEQEKLFGMFTRLHPQEESVGIGAGLAIARRILRRHSGEVRFIDQAEGACVEMRLPRAARVFQGAV
jgi:light-regulated signal transduction histidine kinase (bacteriophytochrome)